MVFRAGLTVNSIIYIYMVNLFKRYAALAVNDVNTGIFTVIVLSEI